MATKYEKYGNSNLFPELNLKMTRLDEKHALQHIHDRQESVGVSFSK